MKTILHAHETVLREGAANLQRGWETMGGRIYLTSYRLVFEPHAVNVHDQIVEIWLKDVSGITTGWTRFLGLIPICPNVLTIVTAQNEIYHFVLSDRNAWRAGIVSSMQKS